MTSRSIIGAFYRLRGFLETFVVKQNIWSLLSSRSIFGAFCRQGALCKRDPRISRLSGSDNLIRTRHSGAAVQWQNRIRPLLIKSIKPGKKKFLFFLPYFLFFRSRSNKKYIINFFAIPEIHSYVFYYYAIQFRYFFCNVLSFTGLIRFCHCKNGLIRFCRCIKHTPGQ